MLAGLALPVTPAAALSLPWRSGPSDSQPDQPARDFAPLQEVSPPEAVQQLQAALGARQPVVEIVSPQPDSVLPSGPWTLRLRVHDWPLVDGGPLGLGPHLVVQLDQEPPRIWTRSEGVIPELSPGSHRLTVYAALPWGEARKNPGASAQIRLHRTAANPLTLPAPGSPQLLAVSPSGAADAEPLLLDWLLLEAPLQDVGGSGTQWRLRVSINGDAVLLDQQAPLWLRGWRPGLNAIQLELLDARGEPLNPPYNSLVQEVDLSRTAPPPRWRAGSLSATELAILLGEAPAARQPSQPLTAAPGASSGASGVSASAPGSSGPGAATVSPSASSDAAGARITAAAAESSAGQSAPPLLSDQQESEPAQNPTEPPHPPDQGRSLPSPAAEEPTTAANQDEAARTAEAEAPPPPSSAGQSTIEAAEAEATGEASGPDQDRQADREPFAGASGEVAAPIAARPVPTTPVPASGAADAPGTSQAPPPTPASLAAPSPAASAPRAAASPAPASASPATPPDTANQPVPAPAARPHPSESSMTAAASAPSADPPAAAGSALPPAPTRIQSNEPERVRPATTLSGRARDLVNDDGTLRRPERRGPLAGLRDRLQP